MSQERLQRGPIFPTGIPMPGKQAQHQDPGDMLNGILIPGKKQRKETKKSGRKVLLCPICSEENCPYTRVVEG